MKAISSFAVFFFISLFGQSQTYAPNDAGSKVHFVIKNFGFKVGGDFTGLKGAIIFNPESLNSSRFNVSVDAKTVDTDNSAMENHLRKPEYFDVEKYPLISFVSTKITNSTIAGRFYVFGNLTIKGVTKAVEFGFGAAPSASGYVFTGEFEINRRDFGVGGSSMSLSDNLKVSLNIAANK
jgi:polyisoprenoid-binding protein YceI